jgi:hypothetical protein
MSVVKFPQKPSAAWDASEMQRLAGPCAALLSKGEVTSWEIGTTEQGDPQLYVIGPPPDHDCLLCVSRLGRTYVVEDGKGNVMFESGSLVWVAEQLGIALKQRKAAMVARAAFLWCALREAFEEKLEPMLAEPVQAFGHFAPFAALA